MAANVPNSSSPLAVSSFDPATGAPMGAVNYTPISTVGTTTVKSTPGIFYGIQPITLGTGTTSTTIQVFDGTTPITAISTLTGLTQLLSGGPLSNGVRFNGFLVVVLSGTGATFNALWD